MRSFTKAAWIWCGPLAHAAGGLEQADDELNLAVDARFLVVGHPAESNGMRKWNFLGRMSEEIPMKKTRFTEARIMGALRQMEGGMPAAELCREHGMWRAKYGGMDASLISEMKTMAEENRRLKRMYADVSMQNDLLKEALKKMIRPAQRRELAVKAVAMKGVSIALACRAFDVRETCYRYSPKLDGENEQIADLLLGLTAARTTWGVGLCFLYLRNVQGHRWNHKRIYRI